MTKLRRSMMYVPGNKPGLMRDCMIYGADSIMFDLEDSVALDQKDAARNLVYNALTTLDLSNVETVVRINDLNGPYGKKDVEIIVKAKPDIIRLPKTETAQDITQVVELISYWEDQYHYPQGTIKVMAAIESALGVLNAYSIATASDRLVAIALGAEDYVTDLHTTRSKEASELLFARSMIVNAARAAHIACFDSVYSDVNNDEGFLYEAAMIKQLGFDGKSLVNPRQIPLLHQVYQPTQKEVDKAIQIIEAAIKAKKEGSGVCSLNGKMVDKPIIERAQRVMMLAKAYQMIDEDEYNEE